MIATRTPGPAKQGRPVVDPIRFPCGHLRSPENSGSRKSPECRECHRQRAAKQRQRPATTPAPKKKAGLRKPWIVPTSDTYKALIAEARAQYLREIGEEPGRVQDSRDKRQHNLWGPR